MTAQELYEWLEKMPYEQRDKLKIILEVEQNGIKWEFPIVKLKWYNKRDTVLYLVSE